jgi:ParB-like chromosome segregation protein Spo0J
MADDKTVNHHTLTGMSDLKPAPYNPRRIDERAQAGLTASIEQFGDISGITWNKRTGHIVSGHQRVEQLKRLGRGQVQEKMG